MAQAATRLARARTMYLTATCLSEIIQMTCWPWMLIKLRQTRCLHHQAQPRLERIRLSDTSCFRARQPSEQEELFRIMVRWTSGAILYRQIRIRISVLTKVPDWIPATYHRFHPRRRM